MRVQVLHSGWLRVQDALSTSPRLFLPLARARDQRDFEGLPVVVRTETELVLEGFPRSGNTFAVAAFQFAQARPVQLAHHLHAAAQVIEGVRRGLPVMVLVREPSEAVLSVVVKEPALSIRWALRSYVRFHSAVWPHRSGFLVVPFQRLRCGFGASIRALNERFGTSFGTFVDSPENLAAVARSVERRGEREASATGRDLEPSVGRPSAERDRAKDRLRAAYRAPRLDALRARAEGLHDSLVGLAP